MIIELIESLVKHAAKEVNFPLEDYDDGVEEMVYFILGEQYYREISHDMEISPSLLEEILQIIRGWQEDYLESEGV